MTAVLEIDRLVAGYDSTPVVRDLSMHVDHGEVVALLGPSGAGKTTTLLTVSQILQPLSGEIRFAGESIVGRRPSSVAGSGLAHVPEERGVFAGLTVAENLRVATTDGDAVDFVTELFPPLGRLMTRRAGLLSGGEQQMLAIGRAVAQRPKLLMVDELSLGLAPVIVDRLLPVLSQIAAELNAGVLMVEQQVQAALSTADRAYVLTHGELVLEGEAGELAGDQRLLTSSYLGEVSAGR